MKTYSFLLLLLFIVFAVSLLFFLFFHLRKKRKKTSRSKKRKGHQPLISRQFLIPEEENEDIFKTSIVRFLLNNGIHKHALFHDLYIKKSDGHYTKIDIVIVTDTGIIVIQTKNYSGKILGDKGDKFWTQFLKDKNEKYLFFNPIIQNKYHIEALRSLSEQFQKIPYYSITLFNVDCSLNEVFDGINNTYVVTTHGLMRVIFLIIRDMQAPYTNTHEILYHLRVCVQEGINPDVRSEYQSYKRELSLIDQEQPIHHGRYYIDTSKIIE